MDLHPDVPLSSSVDSKEARKENLPWVEKYRPSGLTELISHEEILTTLQQLIKSNRLPHLLFYGPPGTGKLDCTLIHSILLLTSLSVSCICLFVFR
jgi:replication-associated recombination protein RarA